MVCISHHNISNPNLMAEYLLDSIFSIQTLDDRLFNTRWKAALGDGESITGCILNKLETTRLWYFRLLTWESITSCILIKLETTRLWYFRLLTWESITGCILIKLETTRSWYFRLLTWERLSVEECKSSKSFTVACPICKGSQYHPCKLCLQVPLVLCFAEPLKELMFYQN